MVRVSNRVCDKFTVNNGLRRCFTAIAFKHVTRNVEEYQEGLRLTGTQLLVCADDVSWSDVNIK